MLNDVEFVSPRVRECQVSLLGPFKGHLQNFHSPISAPSNKLLIPIPGFAKVCDPRALSNDPHPDPTCLVRTL